MTSKISQNDILDSLDELVAMSEDRSKNEAETRHKIIDFILHDYLSWPKNRVSVEEYIAPGFADYVLKKPNDDALLFIEAKKEGAYFELPLSHSATEVCCYVSISKLTSNANIAGAIAQVRAYCMDMGCEYACITNGHEWIFFKTFEKGKKFESLQAFVIRSIQFFKNEYTRARNTLSYVAITEKQTLPTLLTSAPPKDRALHFPKQKIAAYAHPITANKLASKLRPAVNRYFGVINDNDTEFMERCYVSQRDYQGASDGIRTLIQDSLSPYFESFGVKQLDDTGKGGQLGGRLTKILKKKRVGEVLVIFGGKGAGKSTFIKRLLHHNPPRWLREHAAIGIVDLLKVPEDQESIRSHIWGTLVQSLDSEHVLSSPRSALIDELFADRYAIAKMQDLAGLPESSESYNLALNALISAWKSDKIYCATRLVEYWSSRGRGVIIVVDNTDQFSSENQDYCFSSAQEISSKLGCTVIISMREERFYNSKIHGILDAFQNSGFHISSPRPSEVFRRRLDYTRSIISSPIKRVGILGDADSVFVFDSTTYLDILAREFSDENSPLNRFLTACAHGDIRLSLDIFRSFLLSGYTNVEEMVSSGSWKFQVHQVVKPVMIPNRYFYDENLSNISNIYQPRSNRHGSHFTGLRILRKLSKGVDPTAPPYFSIAELRSYFAETFNMIDDFEGNVDMLLKHGFVESDNRIDIFSDSVDSIKITSYGIYMLSDLAYYFSYLDLVCTDSGIFDEQVCNYLSEAARKEFKLFTKGERVERVRLRLERVDKFISYLEAEEARERDMFSLGMPTSEMFTTKMRASFETERARVLKSARRQDSTRSVSRRGR